MDERTKLELELKAKMFCSVVEGGLECSDIVLELSEIAQGVNKAFEAFKK